MTAKQMLLALSCIDSDELAEARRRELSMDRGRARELGQTAVRAAEVGWYIGPNDVRVNWQNKVKAACAAKVSIPPDSTLPTAKLDPFAEIQVQVTNETTLAAAIRLTKHGLRPLALNFANGLTPGGGFLHGARAQEEVLCRSSALYSTLLGDPMYEAHARRKRPDSTEWAIYSPDVPVFRRDDGTELADPALVSFLTCAAPYAPSIGQPESGDLLRARIHRVLAIARAYGHPSLVLGAWGCGAFRNDPWRTATDFRQALSDDYAGAFAHAVFAVTDWSPDRKFLGPFRDVFSTS